MNPMLDRRQSDSTRRRGIVESLLSTRFSFALLFPPFIIVMTYNRDLAATKSRRSKNQREASTIARNEVK